MKSPFEILQAEGLKALQSLANAGFIKEMNNSNVKEALNQYSSTNNQLNLICKEILTLLG